MSAARVDLVLAALADPVRRRLLEQLAGDERAAGELVTVARDEFGISQPATSQHLRVLREAGVVVVRADGPRRLYRVEAQALSVVEDWLAGFLDPFAQPLDALATELARGRRGRRDGRSATGWPGSSPAQGDQDAGSLGA